MCQRSEHEQVVPGVIWCPKQHVLRIWVAKLRKCLGARYEDMSDQQVIEPVIAAALESYGYSNVSRVDVYFSAEYFSLIPEGPDDAA